MKIEDTIRALEKNRYSVIYFENIEDANTYILSKFNNDIIGFGDSVTMSEMGLNKLLSAKNTVIDPKLAKDNDEFLEIAKKCLTTPYFFTSVNAITTDGVLINLDGTGNRIAGSLFGHKKIYYIVGTNKIVDNIEDGVKRVRNVSAPLNAKRLNLKTPCAIKGDRCYNCSSPDRICNGLLIQLKKMNDIDMEIILINKKLGY